MKKLMTLAAVAAMALAAPAVAQDANAGFVGPRVEVLAGYDDVIHAKDYHDVAYAGEAGFDAAIGPNVTLGIEANAQNVFESTRQVGAAARLGYAVTPSTLLFVKGGYDNYRDLYKIRSRTFHQNLDGFVVGGGVEHRITNSPIYVKAEYRYSGFENHIGNSAVLGGVGFRF